MWVDIVQRRQKVMNTQKELKIQIPEGYEIDKEKSTFEKIVFKKKEAVVNCWEDLHKVKGVYISVNSTIHAIGSCEDYANSYNKNVFLNEKYAKSALALAQISQLLPYYDTNVDWNPASTKYCIDAVNGKIEINGWWKTFHVLAFNTREEAKRFLEHNKQLVKEYYMME